MSRELVERVARAWASIDGKTEAFDKERVGMDYDDPEYTGHYDGYMEEAHELLKRSGISEEIERQDILIKEMGKWLQYMPAPYPDDREKIDALLERTLTSKDTE